MDKKTVLIVDDEEDVLTVLEKRLSNAGYTVLTADNGKDALALARSKHPDLMILDVVMPGMSGAEVAEKLGDDPMTKGIPIVFLTCVITKDEDLKANHMVGGNIFIAKPYDIKDLLGEIKRLTK